MYLLLLTQTMLFPFKIDRKKNSIIELFLISVTEYLIVRVQFRFNTYLIWGKNAMLLQYLIKVNPNYDEVNLMRFCIKIRYTRAQTHYS